MKQWNRRTTYRHKDLWYFRFNVGKYLVHGNVSYTPDKPEISASIGLPRNRSSIESNILDYVCGFWVRLFIINLWVHIEWD